MREQLARFNMNDGSTVEMSRDEKGTVNVCRGDICVPLPAAPARQALEMFALMDDLAKEVIFPDEEVIKNESS
ncbi:MAG: hypothetical protein Q7R34_01465 [Dehalococcoidia bacterium]|nr:hypothetical protein [Dehalococcoidia bacterium]